jgi:hypothetical protein
VWDLVDRRDWPALRPLLHPSLRFDDAKVSLRGRSKVLDHLDASPTPKPPRQVEVRDGRLSVWRR